ncbi:uncharacterized protein TNCT_541511 [Trichonephila clavata]|uniref:Uncharacterized protein n=1 Tax=Trichonephila clavata TaxID=2740835 RepID=A0A8X6HRD4_TRICU|nr:uncharacterized protein TNCT_541511 [Trichonephila clavata]
MSFKSSIFFILLLGLLCSCWAVDPRDICPVAQLLTPCFCQKHFETGRAIVRCEKISSNDIILEVLNKTNDYEYESLFVDLSSLTYIPSNIFEIKKLSSLYIFSSTMISLFDKPPNATFLEVLFLHELKLTRTIQWDLFAGFPNLKELYIENSRARNLDQTFRDNVAKTLTKLTLKNCSIDKFDDQIFASLDNLVEINLEDNKVKEPKRSMFSSPSKLEKINLKNNQIKYLPEDIFSGMDNLRHIWLSNNLIAGLNENTLKTPFQKLRSFLVDGNPIKCDCSLKWITRVDRENSFWNNFIGQCATPKSRQGKALNDLKETDFPNC